MEYTITIRLHPRCHWFNPPSPLPCTFLPTNNPTKGLRNSHVSVQKLVCRPMWHILRHNHVLLLSRMERCYIVHGGRNDSRHPIPHRLPQLYGTLRLLPLCFHFLLQYRTLRTNSKTVAANVVLPTPIVIHVHTSRMGALTELAQDWAVLVQNSTPKRCAHSQQMNAESWLASHSDWLEALFSLPIISRQNPVRWCFCVSLSQFNIIVFWSRKNSW